MHAHTIRLSGNIPIELWTGVSRSLCHRVSALTRASSDHEATLVMGGEDLVACLVAMNRIKDIDCQTPHVQQLIRKSGVVVLAFVYISTKSLSDKTDIEKGLKVPRICLPVLNLSIPDILIIKYHSSQVPMRKAQVSSTSGAWKYETRQ